MRCYLCSVLPSPMIFRKLQITSTPLRYALKMLEYVFETFFTPIYNASITVVIFCKKIEPFKKLGNECVTIVHQKALTKTNNNLNAPSTLRLEFTLLKFHNVDTKIALNFSQYFIFFNYCCI